jgi:hypothetical protein
VAFGRVEVESVVEIHRHSKPRLVRFEEPSEPGAEERDHHGIGVGEHDSAVAFRPLPCVEGRAGGEKRGVAQGADAGDAFGVELGDLAELGFVRGDGGGVGRRSAVVTA